jgi:hypothetical protein
LIFFSPCQAHIQSLIKSFSFLLTLQHRCTRNTHRLV